MIISKNGEAALWAMGIVLVAVIALAALRIVSVDVRDMRKTWQVAAPAYVRPAGCAWVGAARADGWLDERCDVAAYRIEVKPFRLGLYRQKFEPGHWLRVGDDAALVWCMAARPACAPGMRGGRRRARTSTTPSRLTSAS